jgi:hypothetical protein
MAFSKYVSDVVVFHLRMARRGRNIVYLRGIREWRGLHNEELRDLYSSLSIIRIIKSRRMRWAGHVALMGEKYAYRLLVGKPEGKRPLGRQKT